MNKIKVKYGAVNIILKRVGAYPACVFAPQITGNITRRVCIPPVLFYINCFEFECVALASVARRTHFWTKMQLERNGTYGKSEWRLR